MMPSMRLFPALLALPLVAGCSGGAETGTPTDNPTAELRATVQTFLDAYLTGDTDTAYAFLSERCQERLSKKKYGELVTWAGALYGEPLKLKSFKAKVDGDSAEVTYAYIDPATDAETERWVLEGGDWHGDDC